MADLKVWFLDVGHGDCAYMELPNGARMMIDCGCGEDHWPSLLLKYHKITRVENPTPYSTEYSKYGLDKLVISHPHGDHLTDIESIHDEIGFQWLVGNYSGFIDNIKSEEIDFRKRGQTAASKFVQVVKRYTGKYDESRDFVAQAAPICSVRASRFLNYEKGMNLNDLSWFVSFEIGGQKVLFTGDMTSAGVKKIIDSERAEEFKSFVKGTTILKIPHHGRDNGCSQELFDAFGVQPLLCVASDESLNEKNETSNIPWYTARTSDQQVMMDGRLQNPKVLTTRKHKDIFLQISDTGIIQVISNCFADKKSRILEELAVKEQLLKALLGR